MNKFAFDTIFASNTLSMALKLIYISHIYILFLYVLYIIYTTYILYIEYIVYICNGSWIILNAIVNRSIKIAQELVLFTIFINNLFLCIKKVKIFQELFISDYLIQY